MTGLTYKPEHITREYNNGDSMTIPEESLTIKQIIARAQTGNIPPIGRKIAYSGDRQVKYDVDLLELQEASQKAQLLKEQYWNEQKAMKIKDIKAKRDAYLEKKKKEWEDEKNNSQ